MEYGYLKIGVYTPNVQVADVEYNTKNVIAGVKQAEQKGVELIVFPELAISSASCGDLFHDGALLSASKKALKDICLATSFYNGVVLVGLPYFFNNNIYNVCAVINGGKLLGLVPKTVTDSPFDINKGTFACAPIKDQKIDFFGESVLLSKNVIFREQTQNGFAFGVEFGQDLFSLMPPSVSHSLNGANVIACLSTLPATVGKGEYLQNVIKSHSSKIACGYAYAENGLGETSTDVVFSSQNFIAENGKILSSTTPFNGELIISDIDLDFIAHEKSKNPAFSKAQGEYTTIEFSINKNNFKLDRVYEKYPFLPQTDTDARAREILDIHAEALKKRIAHAHAGSVVLGLSGGLDSTLAILVAVTAMQKLNRSLKDVVAVTMPCFGTTGRTFNNTVSLAKALGVTLKKVNIAKAVTRHLKDINHTGALDVTFENAQARERTQVLMDIANMNNGLVVGTGDLSELALGWATYNGDHMSMYSVNGALPKTLIRLLVKSYADNSKPKLKWVLHDILDTPVSPELLPAKDGEISQKTEDIVGPYTLHDFYLYNIIRRGFTPKKLYYVAKQTFAGEFDGQTILKWLKTFIRRFFIQQFKRSCLPDGVKVGTVGLSPRSEWHMPSDAVSSLWLKELEDL
ncbi:MAG: NAD(+) synthase [Clostridia bacterium]|nr:NAD(+) synthase [Clostridia bacterium]